MRGRRPAVAIALAGTLVAAAFAPAAASELPAVALFGFELVDTSLEGELAGASAAEHARLRLIGDLLRAEIAGSGRFRVIDAGPAAREAVGGRSLRSCNGCELPVAAALDADFALIGWVQKVSNLILNINVAVREVSSGRLAAGASVDIRGNTDESWSRGARNLVRHHLLGRPPG